MQSFFLTFIAVLSIHIVCAQTDTTHLDTSKIYNAKVLVKGFYMSFDEYLNNAPSVRVPFKNELIYKSGKDSTIVQGIYELEDTSKRIDSSNSDNDDNYRVPHIWGYCDGKYVFITQGSFLTGKLNWVLKCLGKNPCFYQGLKSFTTFTANGIISSDFILAPLKKPTHLELKFIDNKGCCIDATKASVKNLISSDAYLLKKYKSEDIVFTTTMEKYLIKYNERNRL